MNFKHRTPIQVRFSDLDKLGHVNNAKHLSYLELARTLYIEQVLGPDFNWNELGVILARAEIDYKKIICFRDDVHVLTKCIRFGKKSFDLQYKIVRREKDGSETELASSLSVLVCLDYNTFKTKEVPDKWIEKIKAYEGEKIINNQD